jgi:lactose/L-arabinose transport system ATP-binding protein
VHCKLADGGLVTIEQRGGQDAGLGERLWLNCHQPALKIFSMSGEAR